MIFRPSYWMIAASSRQQTKVAIPAGKLIQASLCERHMRFHSTKVKSIGLRLPTRHRVNLCVHWFCSFESCLACNAGPCGNYLWGTRQPYLLCSVVGPETGTLGCRTLQTSLECPRIVPIPKMEASSVKGSTSPLLKNYNVKTF